MEASTSFLDKSLCISQWQQKLAQTKHMEDDQGGAATMLS